VMKSGDARVALIGFPSVGKSTLLSLLTNTESAAADYEFTTLTCVPGVIDYHGAKIQLLGVLLLKLSFLSLENLVFRVKTQCKLVALTPDLPGIIEGASQGRGRGRQVIAVARTADMVLIMLDAAKADVHKRLLEIELETVGIRWVTVEN